MCLRVLCSSRLCARGPIDFPSPGAPDLFQIRIGIHYEGSPRDFQHRKIVNGVAKADVGLSADNFLDSSRLGGVAGYADQPVSRQAVLNMDTCRQHVLRGDSETLRALTNN